MTGPAQRPFSGVAAASRRPASFAALAALAGLAAQLAKLALFAAWLATGMATAVAAPPDVRERLAGERRAVDARHAEAVAACQLRFLVNDCMNVARSQQRLALDGLRRQQLLLDDARRRERAAERLMLQQDRTQAQPQAAQASSPVLRQPRQAAAGASAASAASAPALELRPTASPTTAPASAPRAATGERQHQQAFDQRQQAAREHQRAVEVRNARRDAARQPAGSLPLPGANLPLPAGSLAASPAAPASR